MKKRIFIIGLIALATFLAWRHWQRSQSSAPITAPVALSTKQATASAQSAATRTPGSTSFTSPVSTPVVPSVKEQLRDIMKSANRPIVFFGKVIDQDGNPIPDVKVTFQIRYTKEVGPVGIADTFDYPSVTTGEDGRFALTDAKGAVLAVKSLDKVGYEPSEQATSGTYWYWRDKDPYQPDANNPKIFHMWKIAGAEKLASQEKMIRIPYDGTAVTFDLLSGNKVGSAGDLRVALLRNPRQIAYGQKNYEWTLTVEAVDGGVIESNDEQMFRAPAEGYQSKIVVHMPADAPEWSDKKSIALYLKSQSGKHYGSVRLDVMVGSDKPTTGLMFRSFLNPSGSRNLEYNPLQNVAKP